jgi:hypothetical protein
MLTMWRYVAWSVFCEQLNKATKACTTEATASELRSA